MVKHLDTQKEHEVICLWSVELMHSFCLLVGLFKATLFYSGDTGNLIHRKDIEFNPESFEVQNKLVQDNSTVS